MARQTDIDDVAALGDDLYRKRIGPVAEPESNGKYIAIHVDSGDYVVARSTAAAARELMRTHPIDGRIYLRKIGNEPEFELARRLFADQPGSHLFAGRGMMDE